MCQTKRTEHLIKPPSQRARGALNVQAKAGVAHQMGNRKRWLVTG